MSYTKGKWEVEISKINKDSRGNPEWSIRGEKNKQIASINHNIVLEREANARLIASAPKLLEACKYLANWGTELPDAETFKEMVNKAQIAIKKAEENQ